jgi:outer membrane receptor protein involved in Fe transport
LIGAAVASILAAPSISWAQSADATLRGSAPPSVDVTAKNVATGATRRTKSSADGTYVLVGLTPGTYRVDAGAGTEQVVTLSVASTASLDLGDAGTAASEEPMTEVTVTGRRLREVRTSEVGNTVSADQIENVPQITRNFLEFADTVPGVVFEVTGAGKTAIRGGAQSNNGVNVYIDGVGQKGYVRSGVAGQAGDTQGNPFPQLAIGQYKVITSNYKAEYDQISSAAITAVTRSGTNTFEGEAFGTYSADNWRAMTPAERNADRKTESESKEYGLAFGGPIITDKMHFFVAYEGKRFATPITVVPNGGIPPEILGALPQNALDQLGPAQIEFQEDLLFAKVDWEPSDLDRIEFSVKIRDETSFGDQTGTGIAQSAAVDTDQKDNRYQLSWTRSADRWLNEVLVTYEDTFYQPHVRNSGQNGSVFTWLDNTTDRNILSIDGSDPRAGQNKGQKGYAIADNLTFTDLDWGLGHHTVKMGVKYKAVELTAADAVVNNPVFSYDVTEAGVADIPWKAVFMIPGEGLSPIVVSDDKQYGIYAQDDWEVNDKLTLNLGIRWDFEKNPSYLNFKTPQILLDAFNTVVDEDTGLTYGESLGLSEDPSTRLDINDYISTGSERKAYDKAFAPRLGFSYDFNADQRIVLFGGAGRSYDRDLYDNLQLEQTKLALSQAEVRFNRPDHECTPNGTSCVEWDPAYLNGVENLQALLAGTAGESYLLRNELRVPFSDQFTLGIRNRLGDWQTSAAVSQINSKNGFAFTLGNRRRDGSFWGPVPWGGPAQPWEFAPPGLAGNMIIGGNGIETKNTQLLLSADRPFTEESKWGATVSYTFTDATHNRDIIEKFAFDTVNINQFAFIRSNAAARHRLVATGTYQLPWGIRMAGKLTVATPIPRNIITCYNTPGTAFPSGGQCDQVAYTVGGLGYKSLDLQVTKDFQLGDLGSMYLRLDGLNLTNEENFVDFQDVSGPDGINIGGRYNRTGNITGVPRQLRLSFGVKF